MSLEGCLLYDHEANQYFQFIPHAFKLQIMVSCLGLQFQELILTKVEWFLNPIREQLIAP